ncbi:MAG: DUF3078 domain-containing protein [bacterium]|nr:DUF3078 domain-containing protein [bacterium]
MKLIKMGLVLVLLSTVQLLYAAEPDSLYAWKTTLEAGLGTTQSSYTDNWVGGEVGSLVWAANVHGTAQKQLSPKFRWENELKLAFGQTHSQDKVSKNWASPVKSTDQIRYDAIVKLTLHTWVDPYVAGVFESQFYDASYPAVKRYLNPINLTESAGLSRTLFENKDGKATTRLGFGLRQYITKVIVDTTNETTEIKSTSDGGLEWVTDWNAQLSKNLTYTTKLTLFKALFYSNADQLKGLPNENYWKTIDANWDNILTAKVTQIVQVSLAWQLLYDKEISQAGRFKETLSLGVNWIL